MRLITYNTAQNPQPRIGVRVGHRVLDIEAASRVEGEPLPASMKALLREGRGAISRVQALAKAAQSSAGRYSGAMLEERAIRFLPPMPDADKFLCVDGIAREKPEEVNGAVRLNASLVGHNAKVVRPAGISHLDCVPALVFVIGRRAHGVSQDDDPFDYVAGVTVLNEITAADVKDAPGSCPLGPEIGTLDELGDPHDLWLTCGVNGEERLRSSAADPVRRIGEVLQHFSRKQALEPGDMFSTGTPGKLSLKPGDVVDCAIEGVTTLRSTIVAP